jgi:uncharacterized protein
MGRHATETRSRSRLLAVWPGIGNVAMTAGFYLMSKLHMREEEPPPTGDLFDLDYIDVTGGLAKAGHIPISHLYAHRDPRKGVDLGLVIGEAQPPIHKLEYCRRILDGAEDLRVSEVVTFAAMAVDIAPGEPSRVFGVATSPEKLEVLRRHRIEILDAGQIKGMNGVFLAAAAERGIPGLCLLGSMPAFASQIPYPNASHAVLEAFAEISDLTIDLKELQEYGRAIEQQLTSGLERIREAVQAREQGGMPETESPSGPDEAQKRQIEDLFELASRDRSRAFELKQTLDRLGVFKEYENRFLDLFKSYE